MMSAFKLVKSLPQVARLSRARVGCWQIPLGRKMPAEFSRNVAAEASKAVDVSPEVALEKSSDCAFLDVRTPEEFAAGHAPGAINIPVMLRGEEGMAPNPTFMEAVAKQFPGKETPLLVSCKAGSRSVAACEILTGAGYSQLSNVIGGYDAWSAAGLPSEA